MANTLRLRHPHVSHEHRIVSNIAVFGSLLAAIALMMLILWAVFAYRPLASPSMDPSITAPEVQD